MDGGILACAQDLEPQLRVHSVGSQRPRPSSRHRRSRSRRARRDAHDGQSMKGENMKKIALLTALVAATAFPLAAAQAFNPQPDPPGKMLVNARFVDQSIEDPDINVSLAGELWCGETTIPSNLVIQFEGGRFKGRERADVMCTFNDPADRKAGGTWIGEVLGECNEHTGHRSAQGSRGSRADGRHRGRHAQEPCSRMRGCTQRWGYRRPGQPERPVIIVNF